MNTLPATAADVQELRDQVETLKLQREAVVLRKELSTAEHSASLLEEWGDFVSPMDAIRSEREYFGATGVAGPQASRPSDRADGDNFPFWQNEQQLAIIRGSSEWIAQADSTAVGALEMLTSYVVGTDGQIDAAAKEDVAGAEEAEAAVQSVIDDFLRRSKWQNGIDRETFKRWRRAGEAFIRAKHVGYGVAKMEVWESSWITEPLNARQIEAHYGLPKLDWKYGVATSPGEPTEVWGYYGIRNGDIKRGEFIPAHEMMHLKSSDSTVKRGMPDFYPGQQWFEKAAKLLDRVLDGGAIQASIALIRKYRDGVRPASVRSAADSAVEFETTYPTPGGGSKTVQNERFYSGKVVDIKGADIEAGPMGQSNAPVYLEIVDAGTAKASRTWGMHKTMVTGDAAADTFASALAAETPFTKFCECVQGKFASSIVDMLWFVVDLACLEGALPYDPQQLRQLVDITCKLPDIAIRNKLEEHQIRREQHEAGLLSLETWSEQVGLSYEQEQERGAESQALKVAEAKAAMTQQGGDGELKGNDSGKTKTAVESLVDLLPLAEKALLESTNK